jgi:hypothetical protein
MLHTEKDMLHAIKRMLHAAKDVKHLCAAAEIYIHKFV